MKALIDFLHDLLVHRDCRICTESKPLHLYHPNKVCSQGRVRTCRTCTGSRTKGWYKANQQKRQAAANDRNHKRRDDCIEALGGKCVDCGGEFHRSVYDFHHRDASEKVDAISNLIRNKAKLEVELKKCDLLCANCHRIRHFQEVTIR